MPSQNPNVQFRVTPEQLAALERWAGEDGKSVAAWVKGVALVNASRRQGWAAEDGQERLSCPACGRPNPNPVPHATPGVPDEEDSQVSEKRAGGPRGASDGGGAGSPPVPSSTQEVTTLFKESKRR